MFYSHTWFLAEGLHDLSFAADIAPFPYNPKGNRIARIDADNFTIPKDAKNKQEAWEVMKWLTSPEVIVDVCRIYGCIPARKSVQAAFLEQLKTDYPGIDYDVIFKSIDYLDKPNNEEWIPEWGKIEDALKAAEESLKSEDKEEIEAKSNALMQASQKLGELMYAKMQAEQGGAGGPQAAGESAAGASEAKRAKDDDVVDADFKEVKRDA